MFTDGKTTTGAPPSPVAAAARAAGVVIYCIGLIGSDGIDVSVLNDWATDPDASHVAVTPNAEKRTAEYYKKRPCAQIVEDAVKATEKVLFSE